MRKKLPGHSPNAARAFASEILWGWVPSEASNRSQVTEQHIRTTYGFLPCKGQLNICAKQSGTEKLMIFESHINEVTVVSENEGDAHSIAPCSKKFCASNPQCLQHLGQALLEPGSPGRTKALLAAFGEDPKLRGRNWALKTPIGLRNLGATCFVNSLIQCWFRIKTFRAGVYACTSLSDTAPIYQLQLTFAALERIDESTFDPVRLVNSLKLNVSEQQDVQEFSMLFISLLATEFQKQPSADLRSLVGRQFEGIYEYHTVCRSCSNRSQVACSFLAIEMNVEVDCKLEDCLRAHLHSEELSGNNQYACSFCDTRCDATRSLSIQKVPPVLHFAVSAVGWDAESGRRKKNNQTLSLPLSLDMSPFVDGDSESSELHYDLLAILWHEGSAYGGHYMAQVWDSTNACWYMFNDEVVTPVRVSVSDSRIRFNNASMILYASRHAASRPETVVFSSDIPASIAQVIAHLNDSYELESQGYSHTKCALERRFDEKLDICATLGVAKHSERSQVLDRSVIETWIGSIDTVAGDPTQIERPESIVNIGLNNSAIRCTHGKLDPLKQSQMKRINLLSYQTLTSKIGRILPEFSTDDVCRECVLTIFDSRIYAIEHPNSVDSFQNANASKDREVYLSAQWLKDWRTNMPKFHTKDGDPAPDQLPWLSHVLCEHGDLCADVSQRTLITREAALVLLELFPEWQVVDSMSAKPCQECTRSHANLESLQMTNTHLAQIEKAALKGLMNPATERSITEGLNYLVPEPFLREWRLWLSAPKRHIRPKSMGTEALLCEHGLLAVEPNDSERDDSFCIIKQDYFDNFVNAGYIAPIVLQVYFEPNELGALTGRCDQPICQSCRVNRLRDFSRTRITIEFAQTTGGPDSHKISYSFANDSTSGSNRTMTAGTKRGRSEDCTQATRKSKRLRKQQEKLRIFRINVARLDNVMSVKMQLVSKLDTPPVKQHLFRDGEELLDNNATMEDIGLLAFDTLIVRVDQNDDNSGDGESFHGFNGTLLQGDPVYVDTEELSQDHIHRDHLVTHSPSKAISDILPCLTCTFLNTINVVTCEMCNTPLQILDV